MPESQRRLAAIMYTDIVGYTPLGQRNEPLSLAVVKEHRSLVRPILARHGGREVKTMGDAFLVEFSSAVEGIRCAYDIQRANRELNLSLGEDKRINLRIGIHLGEVVEDHGDILGDAVNVASRIEKLAEAGGVCLTRQVHDQVQGKVDLRFESIGGQALKGVSKPMEVFRVAMPWESLTAGSEESEPRRIAVLPFVNMSPDPNDEYFADGLTEELIDRLSQVVELEVISRTSIMAYKNKEKKAAEIARELRVGSLVEGSVRKAGDKIRVTAQLINARTEGHLWSSRYDRSLEDVFSVQADIAEQATEALRVRLLPGEKLRIQKETTKNTEAYTIYLRAKQLSHEGPGASNREALALLKQAVSIDPSFLEAYVSLVHVYHTGAIEAADYVAILKEAEVAAAKALELGPNSAEAHLAMASVHFSLDRFESARAETEKALGINSNLSEGYEALRAIHIRFGRFEEALLCSRKAFNLDPMSVTKGFNVAWILRVMGRVDEALREYATLKERYPKAPRAYVDASLCYIQSGDLARASKELEGAEKIDPDDLMVETLRGMMCALTGKRDEAGAALESISAKWGETSSNFSELWVQTALGDLDKAFTALMKLADSHAWESTITLDPLLRPLRGDPRFVEFRSRVGLPA